MRCRRLTCLLRSARTKSDVLHALLQQKSRLGEHLAWAKLVMEDFAVLTAALPTKWSGLPCPKEDMSPYGRLAHDFPHEWTTFVNLFDSVEDDVRSNGERAPRKVGLTSHACELCG
eukprot:9905210-Karenia_brevis.AAC.1